MSLWVESESCELRSNATEDDLQVVIRAVYRQVLGNVNVLDSQRLASEEAQLRNGNLTVREFVRAVAKSDLYRSLFFETSSPYQFIELNCKHLLGRAPYDQSEIAEHVKLYNDQGYNAEIDSYLDSSEYIDNYGENLVPTPRCNETQMGAKTSTFNRTFSLMRGYATSDSGKSAQLISSIGGNLPYSIKAPLQGSGIYSNTGKRYKITSTNSAAPATLNRASTKVSTVSFSQMSQEVQSILKSGGRIISVMEIA